MDEEKWMSLKKATEHLHISRQALQAATYYTPTRKPKIRTRWHQRELQYRSEDVMNYKPRAKNKDKETPTNGA